MAHVCYYTRLRAAWISWKEGNKTIRVTTAKMSNSIGGPNSVILFKIPRLSSHTWAKFCYTFTLPNKPSPITLETLALLLIMISIWWCKLVNCSLHLTSDKVKITLNYKEIIGECSEQKKIDTFLLELWKKWQKCGFFQKQLDFEAI